jgi:hypothetical protein
MVILLRYMQYKYQVARAVLGSTFYIIIIQYISSIQYYYLLFIELREQYPTRTCGAGCSVRAQNPAQGNLSRGRLARDACVMLST